MAVPFPLLEIQCTEQYGRGLYSTAKLERGREVFREAPYVHILIRSQQGSRCDWCLDGSRLLKRCAQCKLTWYCGAECQRKDWTQHKMECKGVSLMRPLLPTETMRLVTRVLTKMKSSPEDDPLRKNMMELSTVEGNLQAEMDEGIAMLLMGIKGLMGQDFDAILAHYIIHRILCNTFSICDDVMESVGAGVYLKASLLNHSCDPNCVVLFDKNLLIVRTVDEVAAGSQLFISYVELVDTFVRRKAQLRKIYAFDCQCGRCQREGSSDPGGVDGASEVLEELEAMHGAQDWLGIVKYYRQVSPSPTANTMVVLRLHSAVFSAYIGLANWEKALLIGSTLINMYRNYLFTYHPLQGITLMQIGKLQRLIGTLTSVQTSVNTLSEAITLLRVSHGSAHKLTLEANDMLNDSRFELQNRDSDEMVKHGTM